MKVTVKKLEGLKRELDFEVSKERVSKKLSEVFNELAKRTKIKGFRQGKAPKDVVEKQHGALAKEETVKELIPEVYREALVQENLDPLDYPEISDVNLKDGVVTFKAKIEVKPEIKISSYKEIKVSRKSSTVTEEEINKTLDYFKKSKGADDKTPVDDAFAKGLGYPNLEDFKKSLTRQMEIEKDRQNRADIENQIVEALIKASKFTLPESLVLKQIEHRLEETSKQLKSQGFSDEEIEKKQDEFKKDLRSSVERDVKVYLIFNKIAELEKMEMKEGENVITKVMEFLMKEASWVDGK